MLLGIDVGGTFTDAVIIDGGTIVSSAKRRTTKENLMNGITDALGAVTVSYTHLDVYKRQTLGSCRH